MRELLTLKYMYYNKTMYIDGCEIDIFCKKHGIQIRDNDAKSRSLLNRDTIGRYKFVHKSILEYFLAEKAFNELKFRKIITLNRFNGYDMVKFFLWEMEVAYLREGGLHMRSTSFKFFQLPNIDFSETNITNCYFEGCNLFNANLSKSNIERGEFYKANLQMANLEETKFTEVNLSKADMRKANLVRAEYNRSDLRGVNLKEAILHEAKFIESDLRGINLKGSYISHVNFKGSDLRGVDLRGSDLREIKLERSIWREEDIEEVLLQLRDTIFAYILIEKNVSFKQVYRKELFPNER